MYFIVSFLTSNNQQDSILPVYTFGPLLRYLTSNVSGSKASFSYIESCLASTSLICLSFIHQPWFTEILFSKSVSLASCCTGRKEKVDMLRSKELGMPPCCEWPSTLSRTVKWLRPSSVYIRRMKSML